MSTITQEQEEKITSFLKDHTLAYGLGTEASACSVAAINLSLYNKLTDEIPDCMSDVIGSWIIAVQDEISSEMRNSEQWKNLLPLAAGTGRDEAKEEKRSKIVIDFVWELLKQYQPIADKDGIGDDWLAMITDRQNYSVAKLYYGSCKSNNRLRRYALDYLNYVTNPNYNIVLQSCSALRIINNVKHVLPDRFFTLDWELLDPCGTLHALITA